MTAAGERDLASPGTPTGRPPGRNGGNAASGDLGPAASATVGQRAPRPSIVVTKLRRDLDMGFWRARVSAAGVTLDCDLRWGSWQADVPNGIRGHRDRREVLPVVAAVLQRKVRLAERRENSTPEASA